MKKTILILLAVLVVLLVGCDSSRSNYKDAISAYEDGDYKTATSLFYDLGDYEDSEAYLLSATQEYAAEKISDMENTIKSQDEIDSLFSLCDDLTQAEFAQIKKRERIRIHACRVCRKSWSKRKVGGWSRSHSASQVLKR